MKIFSLEGKKAIVTGGCGGIGRAICEGFHEAGAEVAMIDLSSDILKVCLEIQGNGVKVYGFQGDLSNRQELKNLFEQAINTLKTVDILVNCAGIQRRQKAEDFLIEDWDKVLEINLTSAFLLCQLAGKIMIKNKSGKIINIASVNSFNARINIPAYVASKGAIAQLTKALAVEWAVNGINVNSIAPGYIKTELTQSLWSDQSTDNKITSRIPAGRWGNPDDLKGTAVFLASKASDYINGVIIPVDGGYLAN
jgi:2-dehydro-3-deoxy-D-gluconate 5-dehydrogenase